MCLLLSINRCTCIQKLFKINMFNVYFLFFLDKTGPPTRANVTSDIIRMPHIGDEDKLLKMYNFSRSHFNPAVISNQKTMHALCTARSFCTKGTNPRSLTDERESHLTQDDTSLDEPTCNDSTNTDYYYGQYQELFSRISRNNDEGNGVTRKQCIDAQSVQMEDSLTHTDNQGGASMVQVGDKPESKRVAMATGKVLLGRKAFELVQENRSKKGDVFSVAQIAGIMAAKNTGHMIPLCHNISLTKVDVSATLCSDDHSMLIVCEVHTRGQTGVEMEALVGVSVAALTVYDMCKAVSHDIVITDVRLECKRGGMRGDYTRDSHH